MREPLCDVCGDVLDMRGTARRLRRRGRPPRSPVEGSDEAESTHLSQGSENQCGHHGAHRKRDRAITTTGTRIHRKAR
jgi:hypothetical protein